MEYKEFHNEDEGRHLKFEHKTSNQIDYRKYDIKPIQHQQNNQPFSGISEPSYKFDGHTTYRDGFQKHKISPHNYQQHAQSVQYPQESSPFVDTTTNRATFRGEQPIRIRCPGKYLQPREEEHSENGHYKYKYQGDDHSVTSMFV